MVIKYIAYNDAGERVSGTLEIDSPERAQELLWASNLIVLSLKKRWRRPPLAELMPTFFGVKPPDVITLTRELASLLEAGIALLPTLRVLHEETGKQALKDVIRSLMRSIEEGNPFSVACSRHPAVFSSFYIRLLQVAEETGELEKILREIVTYMEKQRALLGKIKKALTYPAIVLSVGAVAAFILVSVALPAITGLLGEYQAEIPLTTRVLINLGSFSQTYGKYIFGAIVVLALAGWRYIGTPRGKKTWDSFILKVPVINRIIHNSQMARLCSSLTTMLAGGIPTAEVFKLSIEAADNSVFQEGLSGVYQEVLIGSRLEPAIMKQKVFPRLFSQTVGIGEETGALRANLTGLTTYYEQETDRVTSRATDLIEPTMILLIGGVVGFIGIAIVSAIYSMIGGIK